MHTSTSKNNKLIFYKIVHDQSSSDCETGFPSYNCKAGSAVTKQEGPVLKRSRCETGWYSVMYIRSGIKY